MDRPTPILFELRLEPEQTLARLHELLPGGSSPTLADDVAALAPRTFLDTFDSRLHRAGCSLIFTPGRRSGTLELEALQGEPIRRARCSAPPTFADELPPGPLAAEIAPTIAMRRLLPIADLRDPGHELRLVDDLEKTVVRLELLSGTVTPGDGPWPWGDSPPVPAALPPLLLVRPVRGYDAAFRSTLDLLEPGLGRELTRARDDLVTLTLAALGRHPRDYSSKLRLKLDPETPAAAATRELHRTLLATLRANEEGTRLDLDSEFLHDFRVAVRRTRAVLSQVRGVFPAAQVTRFKKGFSWLGEATGPTRDLDVYLLKLPGYRRSLSERVRPHLDPLRTFVEEHQKLEQAKVVRLLRSKRYRKLIEDWETFLSQEPDPEETAGAGGSRRPIRDVAFERIWRTWRRVRKRSRDIAPDSEAAELHRLRIDCKKLRYLLELFRSLVPADQIQPPIRALKKLQDHLGDFNDYEVQQRRLETFADRMVDEDLAPVPTLLAMGRLLAHLDLRQRKERSRFEKQLRRFTSTEQRRRFRELFRSDGTGGS